MSKIYGVEMVTVSKAGLAELDQSLAHERGLREAAEVELDRELRLATRQHEESIVTASNLLKQLDAAEAERDKAYRLINDLANGNDELVSQLDAAEAALKTAREELEEWQSEATPFMAGTHGAWLRQRRAALEALRDRQATP